MLRYVILEKTPYANNWVRTATCQMQDAEYHAFPHYESYHSRALRWGTWNDRILLYDWDDAQILLNYLRNTREYAEYQLMAVVTQAEFCPELN